MTTNNDDQAERVLVCGDRHWRDYDSIFERLARLEPETVIIEGGALGADTLARQAAETLGLTVEEYPADWEQYGRAAGPIRNTQMLRDGRPELVIAFHADLSKSRGTKNMVEQARKAGIPVEINEHGAEPW